MASKGSRHGDRIQKTYAPLTLIGLSLVLLSCGKSQTKKQDVTDSNVQKTQETSLNAHSDRLGHSRCFNVVSEEDILETGSENCPSPNDCIVALSSSGDYSSIHLELNSDHQDCQSVSIVTLQYAMTPGSDSPEKEFSFDCQGKSCKKPSSTEGTLKLDPSQYIQSSDETLWASKLILRNDRCGMKTVTTQSFEEVTCPDDHKGVTESAPTFIPSPAAWFKFN